MPYTKKKIPFRRLRSRSRSPERRKGWLTSPKSGYPIKDGGKTYKDLIAAGYKRKEFTKSKSPRRRGDAHYYISPDKKLPRGTEKGTKKGEYGKGLGSPMRGWGKNAPQAGPQRRRVQEKCGNECFLLPDSRKFPICRKCRKGRCSCKLDCKGVRAANMRAGQWGYLNVSRSAKRILKDRCGE